MADWAHLLGGIFTGAAGGLGQIQQQREQAVQRQLQERQIKEQEKQNQVNLFMKKLDAIPHDADVDEGTLREAATLGMAGIFRQNPESGGFRRVPTLSDRANMLEIESASLEKQINELNLSTTRSAQDPELAKTLLGLPLGERQVRALQLGFKNTPMLPEEELAAAQRDPQYLASRADNETAIRVAQINRSGMLGANGYKMSPEMVEYIRQNPSSISSLSPAQRLPVMQAYMNATGETLPSQSRDTTLSLASKAKMLLTQMRQSPDFSAGIGAPAWNDPGGWAQGFGLTETAVPGSHRANFQRYLDTFRNTMTVPELQHMRGLGHLSEREFQAMQGLGTTIGAGGREETIMKDMELAEMILDRVIDRASRGIRVTDQTDIYTEIEQGLAKQGGASAPGGGYRKVNGKIYGQ
jgi:hypothetical protein